MKRFLFFLLFLFLHEILNAGFYDLIPYRKGELWGYCDSAKKIIIEPRFAMAYPFYGNKAKVLMDGNDFLIDRSGNLTKVKKSVLYIQPEAYNGCRIYTDMDSLGNGVLDENGDFIFPDRNLDLQWISEKYLYAYTFDGSFHPVGIFSVTGKMIVDLKDRDCLWVLESDNNLPGFKFQTKKFKEGVMDSTGFAFIPAIYDKVTILYCGGYRCEKKDSVYFMNQSGKVLEKFVNSKKHPVMDAGAALCTKPHDYEKFRKKRMEGMKDENGAVIVPAKYKSMEDYYEKVGLFIVYSGPDSKRKHWEVIGFVDIYGTEYWE
jgi:hypothetical protein